MKYITAIEASKRIGVSEKTVRLWVQHGKLSAHHPAKNRLAIPESEVERIAREREQYASEQETTPDTGALLARVETLENTVSALLTRIETLESQRATMPVAPIFEARTSDDITPRKKRIVEPNRELPPGCVFIKDFAEQHGVNPSTFRDHVRKGIGPAKERVEAMERPKPGRPGETERYLTPEQQEKVYDFWDKYSVPYQRVQQEASGPSGELQEPSIESASDSGLVPLQRFAALHGISQNEAERRRKAGFIYARKVPTAGRDTIMLDARGRHDFWIQFHDDSSFRSCDDCPHA